MRKIFLLLSLIAIFFFGCKKEQNKPQAVDKPFNYLTEFLRLNPEIANAKVYFDNNIVTSSTQKFKKIPLWEKAYNAITASGKKKVIVPLKYDKNYTFKSSFCSNRNFRLEDQSYMAIYKTDAGDYKEEVVTILPEISTLIDSTQKFSGLITVDDWNENRIITYYYQQGQAYKLNPPSQSSRTSEICMTVDWYWCDNGWITINDCTYIGTVTYENCIYQSLAPGDAGGYVDAQTVMAVIPWTVLDALYVRITTSETIWGVKSWIIPLLSFNHFTSINGNSTSFENKKFYLGLGGEWRDCLRDYAEVSHTGQLFNSPASDCSSTVVFWDIFQETDVDMNPVGSPSTYNGTEHKAWNFHDIF